MRTAIRNKYHLIRYYYTELAMTSLVNNAGPVYQPLFFAYPNDINAFKNVSRNIMVGNAFKLSVLSDAIN